MPRKAKPKSGLPARAEKRLKPYIDDGISKGIFPDNSMVAGLWEKTANRTDLKHTISELGGISNNIAIDFISDCVVTDLSAILRQKPYIAHMEVWEVAHRTVGGNKPRPACFMVGQAVVEHDDAIMEAGIFRMSLWDDQTSIADDVEADGIYTVNVSCRNLDEEILDLRSLPALTVFNPEEYDHLDRAELLKDTFDISPIADLADDLSRTPNDFRLIEAMVSYSDVQNSRAGNQFGKMLLKDDSTMTIEAIESGENLLLNAITSTAIVSRFGKYSKILALVSTKNHPEYGLSANLETAVGIVTIAPPKPAVSTSGDDAADDAADYFKSSSDSDDSDIPLIEEDEEDEADPADSEEAVIEAEESSEPSEDTQDDEVAEIAPKAEETTDSDGDSDDWDEWDD